MDDTMGKISSLLNNASNQNCAEALSLIGRLTHMWQDYYGHAVPYSYDGLGSVGGIGGNPYYIPYNVKPSSYGGENDNSTGEHGFLSEPGNRAVDSDARIRASINFTKVGLDVLLSNWGQKCQCCKGRK